MSDNRSRTAGVALSLMEYGRGIAGGLLFSLPTLYTEEVWDRGASVSPERLLLALLFTFLLLLGYNRYAGLRQDASLAEVAIDSVEEYGLGLLLSALLLWLLNQITGDMTFTEVMGKVILEGMVVAVGVSIGTAQLSGNGEEDDQGTSGEDGKDRQDRHDLPDSLGRLIVLSACGAFLLACSVGPTLEILRAGSQMPFWKLLGVALFSLALSTVILFFSNFKGTGRGKQKGRGGKRGKSAEDGAKQGDRPDALTFTGQTALSYLVALAVAAMVLWFFGRFEGAAFPAALTYVLVLGLPASLGASAGRLLLQV